MPTTTEPAFRRPSWYVRERGAPERRLMQAIRTGECPAIRVGTAPNSGVRIREDWFDDWCAREAAATAASFAKSVQGGAVALA